MQSITGPTSPGAAIQAAVHAVAPDPSPGSGTGAATTDGFTPSLRASPSEPSAGAQVAEGPRPAQAAIQNSLHASAPLAGAGLGSALMAAAAPLASDLAPAAASPHVSRLLESVAFRGLDRGVQDIALRCLAYLETQETAGVRETTRTVLRERGLDSDGDGRSNVVGIACSDGFGALPLVEQKKLLLCLCGAGSSHVLLTFAREKIQALPQDQQAAMLHKMVSDLPLPTRLEEPARVSLDGRPVLDHGEHPYLVPSRDGSQETRMGRTYTVMLGNQEIAIVLPTETSSDPRLRTPSLPEVVRALAALPPELREGIAGVAVSPTRKVSPLGGESAAVADSSPAGLIRLFPSPDWDSGLVDATLVHEAGHVRSNRAWGKAGRFFRDAESTPEWARWKQAIGEDGVSASGYARTAPTEDLSETLRAWFLVKGTPLEADLRALMPHRFGWLDGLVPSWGQEASGS